MEVRMTSSIPSANMLGQPSFTPFNIAGQEVRVSESIHLAAVAERSQDITLTTKEGDTVTLSLDQSTVAVYGRDGRWSQMQQSAENSAGERIDAESLALETREWFGRESSREFTLSVEGDLSAAEKRDIRKALQRIHHLMGHAFSADSAVATMFGLDTLRGIALERQESRIILAARSTSVAALTYGADGEATSAADTTATSERQIWQTAADEAVGMVKATGIAAPHFADPLRHLFRHWAGQMRRQHRALEPMARMMADSVFAQLGIVAPDESSPRLKAAASHF
jgi:hypothetical protein